jgi:hypothetical protein
MAGVRHEDNRLLARQCPTKQLFYFMVDDPVSIIPRLSVIVA